MDSAIAPDNVTGAPTYVHPSSMMVKTAASNNATASFNNSDEQPPTADDVSQSNLLLVKELQESDTTFLKTTPQASSPPRKKRKITKRLVGPATCKANSNASKPRPPTIDANGLHINAKESDIINAERFMTEDRANPQWCHDEELEFLMGWPIKEYQDALQDKTKTAHNVTAPTAIAFIMRFSKRNPNGVELSLDPIEAAKQIKGWADGLENKEHFRFWCGRILRFLRRPKLLNGSKPHPAPSSRGHTLIMLLQKILEQLRNHRSLTQIQTYLSLNWDEISSLLRPQWEKEHPEIKDPTTLNRTQNTNFNNYCWKHCKDLLASSEPPDNLSKKDWEKRLKDVEVEMLAERAAKDEPTPLSNHEMQQFWDLLLKEGPHLMRALGHGMGGEAILIFGSSLPKLNGKLEVHHIASSSNYNLARTALHQSYLEGFHGCLNQSISQSVRDTRSLDPVPTKRKEPESNVESEDEDNDDDEDDGVPTVIQEFDKMTTSPKPDERDTSSVPPPSTTSSLPHTGTGNPRGPSSTASLNSPSFGQSHPLGPISMYSLPSPDLINPQAFISSSRHFKPSNHGVDYASNEPTNTAAPANTVALPPTGRSNADGSFPGTQLHTRSEPSYNDNNSHSVATSRVRVAFPMSDHSAATFPFGFRMNIPDANERMDNQHPSTLTPFDMPYQQQNQFTGPAFAIQTPPHQAGLTNIHTQAPSHMSSSHQPRFDFPPHPSFSSESSSSGFNLFNTHNHPPTPQGQVHSTLPTFFNDDLLNSAFRGGSPMSDFGANFGPMSFGSNFSNGIAGSFDLGSSFGFPSSGDASGLNHPLVGPAALNPSTPSPSTPATQQQAPLNLSASIPHSGLNLGGKPASLSNALIFTYEEKTHTFDLNNAAPLASALPQVPAILPTVDCTVATGLAFMHTVLSTWEAHEPQSISLASLLLALVKIENARAGTQYCSSDAIVAKCNLAARVPKAVTAFETTMTKDVTPNFDFAVTFNDTEFEQFWAPIQCAAVDELVKGDEGEYELTKGGGGVVMSLLAYLTLGIEHTPEKKEKKRRAVLTRLGQFHRQLREAHPNIVQ